MVRRMTFNREWLNRAKREFDADGYEAALAAGLIGFLEAFADSEDERNEVKELTDELIAYEETIERVRHLANRVRDMAESLPREARSVLKPAAYADLADRIDAAIDGDPDPQPEEK